MSKKHHDWQLPILLEKYAHERGIDFKRFGPFHFRLIYSTTVVADFWTTHKYWIAKTNYLHDIVERQGETGQLPFGTNKIFRFLDELMFAVEMKEENAKS